VVTVGLSVVAHGVSASPLGGLYAAHAKRLHPERPEHHSAPHLPVRDLRAAPRAAGRQRG